MLILITLIIGFRFFWQYYVRQFKPLISRILVYSSIQNSLQHQKYCYSIFLHKCHLFAYHDYQRAYSLIK